MPLIESELQELETVYLRHLGVPLPSIYEPTADENPFG